MLAFKLRHIFLNEFLTFSWKCHKLNADISKKMSEIHSKICHDLKPNIWLEVGLTLYVYKNGHTFCIEIFTCRVYLHTFLQVKKRPQIKFSRQNFSAENCCKNLLFFSALLATNLLHFITNTVCSIIYGFIK